MTECTTYRDELLEAAPDELAGIAPTALAEHVRACRCCGDAARIMLAEHARLGTALSLIQPRLSADTAADEVIASNLTFRPVAYSTRDRIQRFAAAVFPMAAAATLAIYVVYGRGDPVPQPGPTAQRHVNGVRITAPPGRGTIVLLTSDPTITFAWIGREITP